MGVRGRKSSASMQVAPIADAAGVARLKAPAHLSEAERALWVELVNDHPADTFRPTHIPLMELYIRHVVQARILADEVAAFDRAWLADDEGLKRYDRLLAMAERESRNASALATRLRITRQALEHNETAANKFKKGGAGLKPWEISGNTVDVQ